MPPTVISININKEALKSEASSVKLLEISSTNKEDTKKYCQRRC